MCVSTDSADFLGTTLYAGRCEHPALGRVSVLGYQNTAVNLATGPNAMVLHLPAWGLSRENFVPVGHDSDVLHRMVTAARSSVTWDGPALMGWDDGVRVFDHDIYTVVLAADPTRIPAALDQVPDHKRPVLRPDLFEFYADLFPGTTIALCCFDNTEARRAKPLLLWYRPDDFDRLVLPALDCHTGAVPDLDAQVDRDHWLLFGSSDTPAGWGNPVHHPRGMRHKLRAFLPASVIGAHLTHPTPNGDFALTHDDLLAGDLTRIAVV